MRRFSADYIFPIASEPIKHGVITIDSNGKILSVDHQQETSDSSIEHYKGIICPGFINTHCHLELSHMRSQIPENLGMTGFIKAIISARTKFSDEQIQKAVISAENEMLKNGIVAVGDISNNNSTFEQKAQQNLLYHTFIEVFDLNPEKAQESFTKGLSLLKEASHATSQKLSGLKSHISIVPHAPYTVSQDLLLLINEYAAKNNSIVSIHNQESEAESELFISHSGPIYETFKAMGINTEMLRTTGANSLQSTLPYLTNASKLLLVHNTYTRREDIQWAEKLMENEKWKMENEASGISNLQFHPESFRNSNLYWCTCPNANLYIENKLPNYNYFINENATVTIGTDSLASNWSLSILDELKTISKYYPEIPLQTLLLWATKNGADFLGFAHLGSIEKGKSPGLNLLANIDGLHITKQTEVIKLV